MADKRLTIQIGDREVDSQIRLDEGPSDHTLVHIASECDGHIHRSTINVSHAATYTPEQAEYDIEQARWESARAAAGKAHIRSLLPSLIPSGELVNVVRSVSSPEHPKPALAQENTGII